MRAWLEQAPVDGVRDGTAQARQLRAPWHGPTLRASTTPTLVLHGDADPVGRPSAARAIARQVPKARLVILPGVGHELPGHSGRRSSATSATTRNGLGSRRADRHTAATDGSQEPDRSEGELRTPADDLVVQLAVGGDGAAAGRAVGAVEVGEPAAGLGDDRPTAPPGRAAPPPARRRCRPRPRRRACRTRSPRTRGSATRRGSRPRNGVLAAAVVPAGQAGVGQRRVLERGHLRHATSGRRRQALAGPGAGAGAGPPAPAERRRDTSPATDIVAVHQGDERRPHRHAADEVLGPVDRVEDPAARAVTRSRRTPHRGSRRAAGPARGSSGSTPRRWVGVRDRCQVRLAVDLEVEALKRDMVIESAVSARTCARRRSSS